MLKAQFDDIFATSLREFAADTLNTDWYGKEHDWVNRYAFLYLLRYCTIDGPLREPGQIAIEVGVPQPPGYQRQAVGRDLVIWPEPGMSCFNAEWKAIYHPLVIQEWKVHRPGHRNRNQSHEREWLRRYTAWQTERVAYAVEVDLCRNPSRLRCSRFQAGGEVPSWLEVHATDVKRHVPLANCTA